MKEINNIKLSFAAIDKEVVSNIVDSCEKEVKGKSYISWGARNDYPQYLSSLYKDCTTLKSIINRVVDFVVGNGVSCSYEGWAVKVNKKGQTMEDVIRQLALSYCMYGGFAINVVRNKIGGVAELYVLDFKKVRSNSENTEFYYSTDWSQSFGRVKYNSYPAFAVDSTDPNSIFYYKNTYYSVYPQPMYGAAAIYAEIEKMVGEYHLNSLANGFQATTIIGLNNGIPSDEIKEEIESDIEDKFCSTENAGRFMVVYSDGKDNAPTVEQLNCTDYSEKYKSLIERSTQELYKSFSMHPVLCGQVVNNGTFNSEDFEEAFKLFNKTVVCPIQNILCGSIEKIVGYPVVIIEQFAIDWSDDEKETKII